MKLIILDENPKKAAEYHCDQDLNYAVLNATQILSNILSANGIQSAPYKPRDLNNPINLWARTSRNNFEWLLDFALALNYEFTLRNNKTHKCTNAIMECKKYLTVLKFDQIKETPFINDLPEEYKLNNTVDCYRAHMFFTKKGRASWNRNKKPWWWMK